MIEFSLNDVFFTLAAGLVALVAIYIPLHLFNKPWLDWIIEHFFPSSFMGLITVITFGFSFGLFIENVSDDWTDPVSYWFEGENGTRRSVLFKNDGTLTHLGRSLYDNGQLQGHGLNNNTDTSSVISRLYYTAKNTVYQHPNHFEELQLIQKRIDFSRAMVLMSALVILSGIPCLVVCLIRTQSRDVGSRERFPKIVFLPYLICILACISSARNFVHEEKEFNKRAFGYFSTMMNTSNELGRLDDPTKFTLPLSGIAKWKSHYLVVSDNKDYLFPRLFNLEVDTGRIRIYPATIKWADEYIPTDIESVCVAGDRDVWILESGPFEDKITGVSKRGQLINLRFTNDPGIQFEQVATYKLPREVINIEGMHCWEDQDGKARFVVAERGGKGPSQLQIWSVMKRNEKDRLGKIKKLDQFEIPELKDLPEISDVQDVRWVSGLAGQREGNGNQVIWATGAIEDGENFASFVYRLGEIDTYVRKAQFRSFKLNRVCRLMFADKYEGIEVTGNPGEFIVVADNENRGGLVSIFRGCQRL